MDNTPSLAHIAAALGGRIRTDRTGPHVVAPAPGKGKRDRGLSVWVTDGGIRCHGHRGEDWRGLREYVRDRAGIAAWSPPVPKAKPVPVAIRGHFFGETLAICRHRGRITPQQFELLVNDLRLLGRPDDVEGYRREFRVAAADLDRAMAVQPRHLTADERAAVFGLTFAERQALGLRRTGAVDVDKAGRERARRDRHNAKRRAARAAAKARGVNICPSSEKVIETAMGAEISTKSNECATPNRILPPSTGIDETEAGAPLVYLKRHSPEESPVGGRTGGVAVSPFLLGQAARPGPYPAAAAFHEGGGAADRLRPYGLPVIARLPEEAPSKEIGEGVAAHRRTDGGSQRRRHTR